AHIRVADRVRIHVQVERRDDVDSELDEVVPEQVLVGLVGRIEPVADAAAEPAPEARIRLCGGYRDGRQCYQRHAADDGLDLSPFLHTVPSLFERRTPVRVRSGFSPPARKGVNPGPWSISPFRREPDRARPSAPP